MTVDRLWPDADRRDDALQRLLEDVHGTKGGLTPMEPRVLGIDPHGPEPEWSVWAPLRDGKPQRSLMLRFYATDLAESTGRT